MCVCSQISGFLSSIACSKLVSLLHFPESPSIETSFKFSYGNIIELDNLESLYSITTPDNHVKSCDHNMLIITRCDITICHTDVCIIYAVNEVTSLQGLGQLMIVALNRRRTQDL